MRKQIVSMTLNGLLSTFLLISVGLNLVLVNRLTSARPPGPRSVGIKMPRLVASDLTGAARSLIFEQSTRPTLLYVYSPTCPWCAKNSENFRTLVAGVNGKVNVIALSLSDTAPAGLDFAFPVYWHPAAASKKAYSLGQTPDTIVIGTDGRVAKRWVGAWSGPAKKDVEHYFGVSLPGLLDGPSASARHGL